MLSFYIDFKCPASYLALNPTVDLATRLGIEVEWNPFRSQQQPIPAAGANESRGETHLRVRAIQQRATHQKYAGLRGVDMAFRDEPGESDLALAGLKCQLADPFAFVRRAFRAYWTEGSDLNDPSLVLSLLSETGNSVSAGALEAAVSSFKSSQAKLEESGLFTTPTYRIADQMFVGREHLPLIERTIRSLRDR